MNGLRQRLQRGETLFGQLLLEFFTPGIGPMRMPARWTLSSSTRSDRHDLKANRGLANSQPASSAPPAEKQTRLFDDFDASAAVDGMAAPAPGAEERDQVQQEPDGDALVLVYPKEDEDAGD
jgi:hypothetical protein